MGGMGVGGVRNSRVFSNFFLNMLIFKIFIKKPFKIKFIFVEGFRFIRSSEYYLWQLPFQG